MEALGRTSLTLPSFMFNFKSTAHDTPFGFHYSYPTSSHAYASNCRNDASLLTTGHAIFRRSSKAVTTAIVHGLEATEISEDAKISDLKGFEGLEAVHEAMTPPLMRVSSDSLQYEEGFLGGISEKTAPGPFCLSERVNVPTAVSYLTGILSSKVYEAVIESPLQYAPKLSEKTGVEIWLKREDLQPWKSVEQLGATVVLVGDSYDEAEIYAKQRSEEDGLTFIPPFDHPDIISGQGTVGMEIIRQLQGPLHAVFVPVGGGGLIAGIAAYIKRVRPEVLIIGVEPTDANSMALSLYHGQQVMLKHVGGFADAVAIKVVGEETFRLCRELVDGVILVSRDAICASIKDMFEEKRSILEPGGALALAGAQAYCKYYGLSDETVVVITSGANMNFGRLQLVTELADVGAKREAVLATFLPEECGSFKQFCHLVGPMNITEFKYRYNADKEEALVLYSVGIHKGVELRAMKDRMESSGLRTLDLTDNDLAKDHLRHLMGGRSNVEDELLCRFVFPERPGALMKFLGTFSPRWNISLFHYRAQGEMGANVLVGIQVPEKDKEEFAARVITLGYEYEDERKNEAFMLLMH